MSKLEVDTIDTKTGTNSLTIKQNDTAAITIDTSQNVGIGTTSPSSDLHINRNGSDVGIRIQCADTTGTAKVQFGTQSDIVHTAIQFDASDNSLQFRGYNNSERMRIDSSGNVLVGRTDNPSGVSNCIYALGNYGITTGSGANVFINSEGLFFRSTSSLRYKNTINDATHGLTELLTLRPVTYKGNNDGDTIFGGLIAEEVHDAGLTEFVQYNDDGQPDALHYGNMVSLCIKAIQELKTENDSLKTKVETLESTVADLTTRLEALENA